MSITLITPTGMRNASLQRCASYVARFANPGKLSIQWIVVDDGEPASDIPYVPGIRLDYVRPSHRWSKGKNTLALNLLAAIPEIRHEHILFIEDDDWYGPDYMAEQYARLRDADLAGEIPARYYHVPSRRYRVFDNRVHASLCQTAIRHDVIPTLIRICERPSTDFIDCRLWNETHGRFRKCLTAGVSCVGLKGLPGREGIGIGHHPERGGDWIPDKDGEILRRWTGNDPFLTPSAFVGASVAAR